MISVRDWFPCDLVRNDEFGKTMYIGVGTNELVFQRTTNGQLSFPPITFVFRLNIHPERAEAKTVAFRILDLEGREAFAEIVGQVPPSLMQGTRLNLNFTLAKLRVPGPAEYLVQLQLADYSFEERFRIRASEEDTQKDDLGPRSDESPESPSP